MPINTSRWIVRTSGAIIASLSSFRNGSSTFKSPSLPFLRLFNTHQHVQNAIVAHIISPHMQITAMAPRTSPGTVLCNTSLVQYDLTIKHTPSVTQSVVHSFMHACNHSIIQSIRSVSVRTYVVSGWKFWASSGLAASKERCPSAHSGIRGGT